EPPARRCLPGALVRATAPCLRPLRAPQPLQGFAQVAWAFVGGLAGGQCRQVVHTKVNADLACGLLARRGAALGFAARRDVGFVHQHAGVPALAALGDGDGLDDAATFGHRAVEPFAGVVQADRTLVRNPQAPVGVQLDGPVESEALTCASFGLETRPADQRPLPYALQ